MAGSEAPPPVQEDERICELHVYVEGGAIVGALDMCLPGDDGGVSVASDFHV